MKILVRERLFTMPKQSDSQKKSENVPMGVWVDVPAGMVIAPNTHTDNQGTLRDSTNDSIVVWHNGKKGRPPCDFKVKTPDQIVYVDEGNGPAPWCPRCAEYNRISAALGPNPGLSKPAVDPYYEEAFKPMRGGA